MKSVTICGSNKFAKEAIAVGKALEKLGVTVYMPHFYSASHLGDWNRVNDFDKKFRYLRKRSSDSFCAGYFKSLE